MLSGNVEYKVGSVMTHCDTLEEYVYVNDTLTNINTTFFGCETTTTEKYASFDKTEAFWYGFLLSLASGFGLGMILMQANRDFKKKKQYNEEFGED